MKIAVIADIHLGDNAFKKGEHVRSASNIVEKNISRLFSAVEVHNPGLIIDMGDLIRGQDAQADKQNYNKAFEHFKNSPTPIIHMLGNHELKNLEEKDILDIWSKNNYTKPPFGEQDLGEYKLVWISFENQNIDNGIEATLPKDQLVWLKETLSNSNKPVLLFTHYGLFGDDFKGNVLFDKDYSRFGHYNNGAEIADTTISSKNVKVVFSAHSHWIDLRYVEGVPFVTLPSATENIAAPETVDNFPEVFTIIEANGKQLNIKAYSRDYCFCNINLG